MKIANALAYYDTAAITAVKGFILLTPGNNLSWYLSHRNGRIKTTAVIHSTIVLKHCHLAAIHPESSAASVLKLFTLVIYKC